MLTKPLKKKEEETRLMTNKGKGKRGKFVGGPLVGPWTILAFQTLDGVQSKSKASGTAFAYSIICLQQTV